jgi:hypothetical protein
LEFATHSEIEDFKASDMWLSRFKKRHSMTFRNIHGEAGDIDLEALELWRREVLSVSLARFSMDDVYNLDETGLLEITPEAYASF